jgi:hypothetical protein
VEILLPKLIHVSICVLHVETKFKRQTLCFRRLQTQRNDTSDQPLCRAIPEFKTAEYSVYRCITDKNKIPTASSMFSTTAHSNKVLPITRQVLPICRPRCLIFSVLGIVGRRSDHICLQKRTRKPITCVGIWLYQPHNVRYLDTSTK